MKTSKTLQAILIALAFIITGSNLSASEGGSKYVVYYFYQNFRCYSCNAIEEMTKKSLTGGKIELRNGSKFDVPANKFAFNIKSGNLSFESLNSDKAENKHFLTDFKTRSKYPVMAEIKDGKVVRYEVLKDVWSLLKQGDAKTFVDYIQSSLQDFMTNSKK